MSGNSDGLEIDKQGLKAMAGNVDEASGTVGKAYTAWQAELAPGGSAAAGWSCVAATREASAAWGPYVKQLASSVDKLADDMRSAADNYQASDTAAQGRLHPIGAGPYAGKML